MGDSLRRALAKRGAVFLAHEFEFPNKTKAKYCVLLESYHEGAVALYVALTTHRKDFLKYPTAVLIPDGTVADIDGDSVLQSENLWPIPVGELLSRKMKYLGSLPVELMEKVDQALDSLEVTEEVYLRICGLDP